MSNKCKKLRIWKDCSPLVAEAVRTLEQRWSKYSDRGGRYRLGSLVYEVIDPAWRNYVLTIESSSQERDLCENFEVLRKSGKRGFRLLEDELRELDSQLANLPKGDAPNLSITRPTLETIREVIRGCERKRPFSKIAPEGRRRTSRSFESCQLCGNLTELATFVQMTLEERAAVDKKLSGKYCKLHTPKLSDGSWNPKYRSDRRKERLLQEEIEAIRHNSCYPRTFRSEQNTAAEDQYLRRIAERMQLRVLDDRNIANLARALVDHRIDSRKRTVLALHADGMSQANIARHLKIGRHTVCKIIHFKKLNSFNSVVNRLIDEAQRWDVSQKIELGRILRESQEKRALLNLESQH